MLSLRWENIDFDQRVVRAIGKSRKPGGKVIILPLTDQLVAVLEAIGRRDVGPVITWRGRPVREIKTAFNRARARAGLPHVQFRDLRHSVAMEILSVTGSLDLAGAILGHSDPSVTRKHYARFRLEQM